MAINDVILHHLDSIERTMGFLPEVPDDLTDATAALRRAVSRCCAPRSDAICFNRRESKLVLPNGTTIELTRRRALQSIALALIEARLERPGEPISARALIARGWPEFPIRNASTANRLSVALTRLRQVGLGDYLVRTVKGWMLSPLIDFIETSDSELDEQAGSTTVAPIACGEGAAS